MWNRFTEKARKTIWLAQESARKLGDGYLNTEHLLLGLAQQTDTVAAATLKKMSVDPGHICFDLEKQMPPHSRPGDDIVMTPRAKSVIDLAYDEAKKLDNLFIDTGHLLLALIREKNGLAGIVLIKHGADLATARIEVASLHLSGVLEDMNDTPEPSVTATGEIAVMHELIALYGEARANNLNSVASALKKRIEGFFPEIKNA